MKLNFCTLFDINYLTRALVMYESLVKYAQDFHLYVFAFDHKVPGVLNSLNLPAVTVITLEEFEDQDLLKVKPSRSAAEYCWTSTSSTIRYVLDHYKVSDCTYIDADLCFYSDPGILFQEMGSKSILLTEHDYSTAYNQNLTAGKYCVQFMRFVADNHGRKALSWWRDRCLEWCFNRHEDGKFGDQKYLDDWTDRFEGVHVLRHRGGGVAPWNIQRYAPQKGPNGILLQVRDPRPQEPGNWPLVFYHFHGVRFFDDGTIGLDNYKFERLVIELLYRPYLKTLLAWEKRLTQAFPELSFRRTSNAVRGPKKLLSWIKNKIMGTWNFFKEDDLIGLSN